MAGMKFKVTRIAATRLNAMRFFGMYATPFCGREGVPYDRKKPVQGQSILLFSVGSLTESVERLTPHRFKQKLLLPLVLQPDRARQLPASHPSPRRGRPG